MRIIILALLLMTTACDGKNNDKPLFQLVMKKSDKGYQEFLKSCVAYMNDNKTCLCQVNILKNKLTDEKLALIAEAGNASANNDKAKLTEINNSHPELLTTLKLISIQTAECNK